MNSDEDFFAGNEFGVPKFEDKAPF